MRVTLPPPLTLALAALPAVGDQELLREWFEAEPWRLRGNCSGGCKKALLASSPTGGSDATAPHPAVDSTDFFMKAS